jgi:hypothetical protein
VGQKLNETLELLAYADVNPLGDNVTKQYSGSPTKILYVLLIQSGWTEEWKH